MGGDLIDRLQIKPEWLADFDGSRANNFTLLRTLFAVLVMVWHSWALTNSGLDPLTSFLSLPGVSIGGLAVNGFFAISGFLVTGSFVHRGVAAYVVGRLLRIYPALVVCILASVFFLGLAFTTLSPGRFLGHPATLAYLSNITLWHTYWNLPGVFREHRIHVVNGSLWTLPVEVRCYVAVLLIGVLGGFRNRAVATVIGLLLLGTGLFLLLQAHNRWLSPFWIRPFCYFTLGSLTWINRKSIALHPLIAIAAIAAIGLSRHTYAFQGVLAVGLVYLIFFAAFALKPVALDRFGDLSYGIYLFAWPVQQVIYWPKQSAAINAILAMTISCFLAALSWHLVEKPTLQTKDRAARWVSVVARRVWSRGLPLIGDPGRS